MKKYYISGIVVVVLIAVVLLVTNLSYKNELAENEIPMYGFTTYEEYKTQRTPAVAKVDDDFVTNIVEKKGSTKAAFEESIKLAWSYLGKGDSRTAMKRCNQAWLIDHTNYNVNWCYGAILGSMDKNTDAAPYFDKALNGYSASWEIYPDDYLPLWRDAGRLFTVLSDTYSKTSDIVNTKKYSEKAITLLSKFLKDPKAPDEIVPNVSSLLISAYLNNGDYQKARTTYEGLVSEYPDIKKDPMAIEIDEALKEKGY